MSYLVSLVFHVGVFFLSCDGYRILVVFPIPAKSHMLLGDGYVDNLLEAGHQVTLITPYPKKNPSPNLTEIDVSANQKFHFGQYVGLENVMNEIGASRGKYAVFSTMYEIARSTVQSEGVQRLLKDPQQRFDLVVAEWLFSDFYAGFAAVFNCPYIWSVSMNPSWLHLRLVEASGNPEFFPDMHSANYPPFSPVTRILEFANQINVMAMTKFKFSKLDRQLYENNIVPILTSRGRNVPDFEELVYNASGLIVNSHAALAQVMPLPANCITVGGYHISSRAPPLPENLQKLMDEATDGVIYFSMGTNINSETFPKSVIQGLLDMFKGLKQLVLWKISSVESNLPNNVRILPWAPQQSILRHPKCMLLITHGGYLSFTEAVHFGVPVVAVPVFSDQFANAAKLQLRGIGQKVDLTYNFAEDLGVAIREVIRNPRYEENVEQLSSIYHDQKSPRRRLVDFIQLVIRSRGAAHLRSPAIMMPWYQQVYLDLLLVVFVAVGVLFWVLIMFMRCLLN